MKNKYFGIVLLILTIVSCTGKAEKDKWAKEKPDRSDMTIISRVR
jgi:hypothetical protein